MFRHFETANERDRKPLILRNRSLCFLELGPSWRVRISASIQQLAKVSLTRFGTSAELGGVRCPIEAPEPPRLFRQCSFELLQRLCRLP
jgi:hypothetical protein